MRTEIHVEECLDMLPCIRKWNGLICTEADPDLDYLNIPTFFRVENSGPLCEWYEENGSKYTPTEYDEDYFNVPTYLRKHVFSVSEQAANDISRISTSDEETCEKDVSGLDLDFINIPACFRYGAGANYEIELAQQFSGPISDYFPPDEDVSEYIRKRELESAAKDQCSKPEIDIDDFGRLKDVVHWRINHGNEIDGIEFLDELLDLGLSEQTCSGLAEIANMLDVSEKVVISVFIASISTEKSASVGSEEEIAEVWYRLISQGLM